MAVLAVVGKRYGDAGIKDIASLSGIVAEGSIPSVISGKSYNRAIRLYKLIYEALLRMLIEFYHASLNEEEEESIRILQE